MNREQFEEIAQRAFDSLPKHFREKIENVQIVVEEYPSDDAVHRSRSSKQELLGLYQGIPLTRRDTSYGMYPVGPDKITLYQKNIERVGRSDREVQRRIVEVLFHELGHYFGMDEAQVRAAMKDFE